MEEVVTRPKFRFVTTALERGQHGIPFFRYCSKLDDMLFCPHCGEAVEEIELGIGARVLKRKVSLLQATGSCKRCQGTLQKLEQFAMKSNDIISLDVWRTKLYSTIVCSLCTNAIDSIMVFGTPSNWAKHRHLAEVRYDCTTCLEHHDTIALAV